MTRRGTHVPPADGPMYAAAARRAAVIVTLDPSRRTLANLIYWPLPTDRSQLARVELRTGWVIAVRPAQIELAKETAA